MSIGKKLGEKGVQFYRLSTKTWDRRVLFEYHVNVHRGKLAVSIGTEDRIYILLDEKGSPPHTIVSKGPWPLAFQSEYKPKTTPGKLKAHAGGASGPMVYTGAVQHPGFEPRHFTEQVAKKITPYVLKYGDLGLKVWVRKNWR
jgi:hypothetical protein